MAADQTRSQTAQCSYRERTLESQTGLLLNAPPFYCSSVYLSGTANPVPEILIDFD
jgi:hypothetical protein